MGKLSVTVTQGEDWSPTWIWYTNYVSAGHADNALKDLTGYEAALDFKARATSATAAIALSTTAGGLTLGGAAGTITPAAEITVEPGNYVGDLRVTDPAGDDSYPMEITLIVKPRVTEPST